MPEHPHSVLITFVVRAMAAASEAVETMRDGADNASKDDPHEYHWMRLKRRINELAESAQKVRKQVIEPRNAGDDK